ncbi:MAG: hypothetical protein SPG09_08630 [Lachnospiraceae bacterium]|nr:hypothetical protein [bacterium]MDY5517657.1 hypothetical protein [Lachnospiraceae bacterium]
MGVLGFLIFCIILYWGAKTGLIEFIGRIILSCVIFGICLSIPVLGWFVGICLVLRIWAKE